MVILIRYDSVDGIPADDWTGPHWTVTGGPICPDLLRLEQIGAADNLRGWIVRLFFRVLDRLMPVRP